MFFTLLCEVDFGWRVCLQSNDVSVEAMLRMELDELLHHTAAQKDKVSVQDFTALRAQSGWGEQCDGEQQPTVTSVQLCP